MAEARPRIRWRTVCVAACWALFCFGSIEVTSAFRGILLEMNITGGLPAPTRVLLLVTEAMWTVLGLVVAAGLIVKSAFMSARASRVVDMVSVLVLLAAGAAEVVAFYLPFSGGPAPVSL